MRRPQQFDWFYKKPAWKAARLMALDRDNYLCVHCDRKGEMKKADVVHHIVYVEHDITQALNLDNLISLCHACHNDIHREDTKRYQNTEKNKRKKMIEKKREKINIFKI